MKNTSTVTSLRVAKLLPEHYLGCLRGTSLFSGLAASEMACFQEVAQTCSYKKGKVLYIEEDPAASFYVIISGWIKLFHTTPEGEEVIVDMLTAGHIVGENSIFEDGCHTSSAMVIGDVQLISIPSHVLKTQIRLNPALALSMLSSMSRHHRRHYDEIALNALQSAPQRIGCFLLKLCPTNKKRGVTLQLPYDKTLIAYILGIDGATFSRALNMLRQKTDIRISGSRVEIDSVEQLTQFVCGSSQIQPAPAKVRPIPAARDAHFVWNSGAAMRNDCGLARHAG